jgi:hypothetical protein
MKLLNNNILLKNYIFYLIKILNLTIDIEEINFNLFQDIENLFYFLFITQKHSYKIFNNKFKYFLRNFRNLKKFLNQKHDKILFNKIYKIFFDLKTLLNIVDIDSYLNLTLIELSQKNLLIYLPYRIDIKIIFKNN